MFFRIELCEVLKSFYDYSFNVYKYLFKFNKN